MKVNETTGEKSDNDFVEWVKGRYGLNEPVNISSENGWILMPQWQFAHFVREYRSYRFSTYVYIFLVLALAALYVWQMFMMGVS